MLEQTRASLPFAAGHRRSPFHLLAAVVLTVAMIATCAGRHAFAAPVLRTLPTTIHGVTIDAIDNLPDIVTSLDNLAHMPMTRIVFDEWIPATTYRTAVDRIRPVSYILGEILDSFYVRQYTVDQYKNRTTEYLNAFVDKVDLWEVGNEINGEWLGSTSSVVAKMSGAYDLVKARGARAALTLYYNYNCWERPSNEMFTWAQANVPTRMKQGLDYVLVSYYEDDCNGYQPNWQAVFDRLGTMFPNSKIGIGECGTTRKAQKATYIRRYYDMTVNHPRFIGGHFWWYYKQDMVPMTKPLWPVLNDAIR
jgi:hypothetical protein